MGIPQLALVAVAISLDTFAAGVGLGTRTHRREWLRIALIFAVSGGLFPLVGMWIGVVATGLMAQVAEAVGIVVLAGLGLWFMISAWRSADSMPGHLRGWLPHGPPGAPLDPNRRESTTTVAVAGRAPETPVTLGLGPLIALSMGLSADNLLVGLGLGLYGGGNMILGAFVSVAVFVSTLLGLTLGRLKVQWFGRGAEALAGLLILGLAAFFFFTRG